MELMSILLPILILILITVIIFAFVFISSKKQAKKRAYKPKGPYLLNSSEKILFHSLSKIVNNNLYVCPKVRIADIVTTNFDESDKDFWKYQAPINQKHVDFLICDKKTFSPILAIELDGGSHNDPDRIKRDSLVDSVFATANIPILHLKSQNFYNQENLKIQIFAAIKTD
jgi:uncharacterized protein DUF2726